MRTVFNLLGPLTNPAGATAQLVGAPSGQAAELMAGALAQLGLERGFVVHGIGRPGRDHHDRPDPGVRDPRRDRSSGARSTPEDFGVARADAAALKGGDKARNVAIARAVLGGAAVRSATSCW